MDLHPLIGQRPRSSGIESLLTQLGAQSIPLQVVPSPIVKIYKDAVYYSYKSLGISFNFEPSQPLIPAQFTSGQQVLDPAELTLVAIHLYKGPADQFSTFPTAFFLPAPTTVTNTSTPAPSSTGSTETTIGAPVAVVVEMDMSKKAHEIVLALGEPEEKQGGGRNGNCWIGYQKSLGFAVDFAGANWNDGDMSIASVTLTRPGDCR